MEIELLLKRSSGLEKALGELFELEPFEKSNRYLASRIMCSVSLEHAQSVRVLVAADNLTSAFSLVRLQFEALVRSVWTFYSASDTAISRLINTPTLENEKKANSLPMLSEMLKQLDGKAPAAAVAMLNDLKVNTWKSLSSYVHGGIHAVNTHASGCPEELIDQIVRVSNGISTMVGMMLAIQSGEPSVVELVRTKIQPSFRDCLPELLE